jgi:transporter family protein
MHTSAIVSLLGVLSALCWGFSDVFGAKSAKTVGPILSTLLVTCLSLVFYIIIYICFLHPQVNLGASGVIYAFFGGICLTFGGITFYLALEQGPVSIVSPISSMYPLVTTLAALVIFHAVLTAQEILGIGLIVFGVMLATGIFSAKKRQGPIKMGPFFSILTVVGWGLGYALITQAISRLGWPVSTLIEAVVGVITLILLIPLVKGDELISTKVIIKGVKNKFILGACIFQLVGSLALIIGISKSSTNGGAVITAISSCYPILVIFVALKHFKEEFKIVPITGSVIGIVGVIILSV